MKVLVLCHQELVPPNKKISIKQAEYFPWRTEYFVSHALKENGHQVFFCGLLDQLRPLRHAIQHHKPDVVFNLLEEFDFEGMLEGFVVDAIEQFQLPYTGCHSEGLIIAKNKLATKVILASSRVLVPGARDFPKIVKLTTEDSSRGISAKSIVNSQNEMRQRTVYLKKKFGGSVFSESYISGRELHVGVLPNGLVTPVWETVFTKSVRQPILTESLKWNFDKRDRLGIHLRKASLNGEFEQNVKNMAKKSYKSLRLNGCARIDIRLTSDGKPYVLEVNPNPDLARWDEFAMCAKSAGVSYNELIDMILNFAIKKT